ncbi:mCG1041253, isoform CRA_e [Mus musculus]|nr:mCG1041253, isoform CRA_e [Mus musculus]
MRVVGMYHGGRVMAAGSWNRTLSKNTFNYKQKSRRTESGSLKSALEN